MFFCIPKYSLPHPPPSVMSNTLLTCLNIKQFLPPLVLQLLYIFSYIIDVNLKFIMHENLDLALRFPKSPPCIGDTPSPPSSFVSNT